MDCHATEDPLVLTKEMELGKLYNVIGCWSLSSWLLTIWVWNIVQVFLPKNRRLLQCILCVREGGGGYVTSHRIPVVSQHSPESEPVFGNIIHPTTYLGTAACSAFCQTHLPPISKFLLHQICC